MPAKALCLVAALCGPAAQAGGLIKVDNALAHCVELRPGVRTTTAQQVMLQVDLNVKKSIGECGCKSAISAYTSEVQMEEGHRSFLQRGALTIQRSGVKTLTLASDEQLVRDRGIVLSLSCGGAG